MKRINIIKIKSSITNIKYGTKVAAIYAIRNKINQKVYIGSTKNMYKRVTLHLYKLAGNKHTNSPLQNDYNKYGKDNFEYIVLLELNTTDNLEQEEQWFMDIYKDYLYNLDSADGKIRNEKTLKIIRTMNIGKIRTPETIEKLRKVNTGKKIPDEQRLRMIAGLKGKKRTEEQKEKIRQSLIGHEVSEETRKKISEKNKGRIPYNLGKKTDEETRNKQSISAKNRKDRKPHSEETKKKMSEAKRLGWAKRKNNRCCT